MNRRNFLKTVAGAAVSASIPSFAAETGSQLPCLRFFSKPLQFLDYEELAETLANIGIGGIEPAVRTKGHVEPENAERDLPRLAEAARRNGLKMDMMVTSLLNPDDAGAERLLKTAVQCGIKYYRMGYFWFDLKESISANIDRFKRIFARFETLNERCGITGTYQNHYAWKPGILGGYVWDLYDAVKECSPRWVGIQYDVCHAAAEAVGSWPIGMRLISSHIRSLCLKDFLFEKPKGKWRQVPTLAGEGMVNWKTYFDLIRELKLDVPMTVHCEWPLFTKEEELLPKKERDALLLRKMKRDIDFFKSNLMK